MAQFQFRLITLLKLREAERQRRRLDLAQAYEADRFLQQQIDEVAAELALTREQVRRAASPGAIQVDELLEIQRYAVTMQVQSRELRERQRQVREEIERRRAVLVEADRQVRMLEKLREKQEIAFRAEQHKVEQKESDEIGARP